MTYTPDVPQAGQRIAFTQPLIEANFQYIDTAMKVDHAWNGNEIDSQADGSHQKVSLPDQAADIAALPAGITSIMYAKDGNLFAWNGTKNAVSGIVQTGTLSLTDVALNIVTLPTDCMGIISISTKEGTSIKQVINYNFFTTSSVGYVSSFNPPAGSVTTVNLLYSGLILQAKVNTSTTNDYIATYKLIYWPL